MFIIQVKKFARKDFFTPYFNRNGDLAKTKRMATAVADKILFVSFRCYNTSEKVCLQELFHAIFQQKRRFGKDKAHSNGSCRQNSILSRFDVIIQVKKFACKDFSRHISTETAIWQRQSAWQRQLPTKFYFVSFRCYYIIDPNILSICL